MLLEIESLLSQSAKLKASHKNYENTRAAISNDQNISLEEFLFMQKRSATEGVKLEISSLPGLKEKLDESENTLSQLTLERHQLDEAMEKHLIEFRKRLGTSQDLRQLQVTSLITAYENILTELVTLFATLLELVELAPGTLLSQLRIDAAVWKDSLAVIRTEMTKSQNLKQHTDNLASAENFILRNTLTAERMEKARKTLSRLIENDGSSKLKDFFNQNLEEIANVFRAIHQPREFRSIDFQNNKLVLTTLTEEKRTLGEVSSGQRSAIALAIFITLNRKLKDGPDIILFDDPVSYVDDMNSLSFLDFLRFFILNEGKQIFFATANDKLARLFQKKFEYLGDDFQRIELSRLE
jgi:DNA repair protein SbcC/Rad50